MVALSDGDERGEDVVAGSVLQWRIGVSDGDRRIEMEALTLSSKGDSPSQCASELTQNVD